MGEKYSGKQGYKSSTLINKMYIKSICNNVSNSKSQWVNRSITITITIATAFFLYLTKVWIVMFIYNFLAAFSSIFHIPFSAALAYEISNCIRWHNFFVAKWIQITYQMDKEYKSKPHSPFISCTKVRSMYSVWSVLCSYIVILSFVFFINSQKYPFIVYCNAEQFIHRF